MELSKYVPKTEFNLSLQERNCLKNLKHDENIIIHKADKNNVTVIQNLSDYLEEGEKQLNDNIHYEQIQDINLKNTQKKVYEIIYKMKEENCIDEISFKYIKNEQNYIKTPFAYFLPKIHKLDREVLQNIENENNQIKTINVPGRPIISQCNGPLERLGRYLDYFLLPLVKTQKTYISDTGDLIRNIENCTFDNNVLLVTYDITSLYTNLRFEEITEALQKALDEHDKIEYSITKPTNNFLIEITKLILSNNEFTFHGKSYRQIIGASMGATASPEICDIAIYNHINSILKNSPISEKIIFHKRMRDDGLLMVKAKESEIDFITITTKPVVSDPEEQFSQPDNELFDVEIEIEPHHDQPINPTNKSLRFKSAPRKEVLDLITMAGTDLTTNKQTVWGAKLFRDTRLTVAVFIYIFPFK
ncbi:unnamed protein product [Mytilus edulis]|uniref:Reverse transcriptase domain-containing protein n=1 Tax=Mytilus edulis TaxID=6550 RepID=A0A8S3UFU5_MYTED|nr:unnamed protein product [Mytilus edulis]